MASGFEMAVFTQLQKRGLKRSVQLNQMTWWKPEKRRVQLWIINRLYMYYIEIFTNFSERSAL